MTNDPLQTFGARFDKVRKEAASQREWTKAKTQELDDLFLRWKEECALPAFAIITSELETRGLSVEEIEPLPNVPSVGISIFEKKETPIFEYQLEVIPDLHKSAIPVTKLVTHEIEGMPGRFNSGPAKFREPSVNAKREHAEQISKDEILADFEVEYFEFVQRTMGMV